MKDKALDEIREMFGEVPPHDLYITKRINVKRKKETVKLILDKYECDILKSRFKDNIKTLAKGKDTLFEVSLPTNEEMSKCLTEEFKDGRYESTIDRKNAIRQRMYSLLLGSTTYSHLDDFIDEIYDINVISDFLKGEKRLRNKAIKELNTTNPAFLISDGRIRVNDYTISVQPMEDIVQDVDMNAEFNRITDFDNKPKEIAVRAKEIADKYSQRRRHTEYRAYKHSKKIKSVLADNIIKETVIAIKETKQFEDEMRPKLEEIKEHNFKVIRELEQELNVLLKSYNEKEILKLSRHEKDSECTIETEEKIPYAPKWSIANINGYDTVIVTYNKKLIAQDTKDYYEERNWKRHNDEENAIGKDAIELEIYYEKYETWAASRYGKYKGEIKMKYFAEKVIENEKKKIKIHRAKGIWGDLQVVDFNTMKPFFDEDMELIQEVPL